MTSVDELFQQGFVALQKNDDAVALNTFRAVLEQDAGHFGANYMMACEAAHVGDIEGARQHFRLAMVREPAHSVCRFQAGLLELTSGDLSASGHLWAPLEQSLPDGSYIKSFVQGCLAMALDRFDEAKALLRAGLQSNQENPALNNDMLMLLTQIEALEIKNESSNEATTEPESEAPGSTLAALNMFQRNKTRH